VELIAEHATAQAFALHAMTDSMQTLSEVAKFVIASAPLVSEVRLCAHNALTDLTSMLMEIAKDATQAVQPVIPTQRNAPNAQQEPSWIPISDVKHAQQQIVHSAIFNMMFAYNVKQGSLSKEHQSVPNAQTTARVADLLEQYHGVMNATQGL